MSEGKLNSTSPPPCPSWARSYFCFQGPTEQPYVKRWGHSTFSPARHPQSASPLGSHLPSLCPSASCAVQPLEGPAFLLYPISQGSVTAAQCQPCCTQPPALVIHRLYWSGSATQLISLSCACQSHPPPTAVPKEHPVSKAPGSERAASFPLSLN